MIKKNLFSILISFIFLIDSSFAWCLDEWTCQPDINIVGTQNDNQATENDLSRSVWDLNWSEQASWEWNLASKDYMIDTNALWIWSTLTWSTAKETVENTLSTIVNKLMIAFWVLALFIMTIGWWYMIFAHWQDELLNKWKGIFIAWLTSLVVALWSWIIIKIVIFLLY